LIEPVSIRCPTASEPASSFVAEDYDQPPRPIKITRPQYPSEAFDKKDDAAARTTCQWVFQPAMKDGQPVPTTAHAPVAFRIY
jgi:hypothetical protein